MREMHIAPPESVSTVILSHIVGNVSSLFPIKVKMVEKKHEIELDINATKNPSLLAISLWK